MINGRKACSIGLKVHTSIVFFQTIVYTNLLEIVTVYIILQHEWSNNLHQVRSDNIPNFLSLINMNTIIQQKQASEIEETKIFLNNAFFFLAHSDRIMRVSRMFLALVPVQNGPISFGKLCLGAYLEWWLSYDAVRKISEGEILS